VASLLGGTGIKIVGNKEKGKLVECDAMITKDAGVGLFMVTADCLPVVAYDRKNKILVLVHLGWRGVDGKLIQKVVSKMQNPQVWIGPGVRKETYIKYGEKLDFFMKNIRKANIKEWDRFLVKMPEGKVGIDLAGYVIKQVTDMGVDRKQIAVSGVDIIKDTIYFSHFRAGETGEKEGRFATVVTRK